MLGRDKITIHFRSRETNEAFSRTYYGRVITEQLESKLEPLSTMLVITNYYRLLLPRTLDLTGASIVNVDFGIRRGARFETIVPVLDGRGRIRHYEGVVRSN